MWSGAPRPDPSPAPAQPRPPPRSRGGGFLGMSFGAGALWFLNSDGTVVRIDPSTNSVVSRIATASGALSLAAGDDRVWVSCCGPETRPGAGRLIGIDPSTNKAAVQ